LPRRKQLHRLSLTLCLIIGGQNGLFLASSAAVIANESSKPKIESKVESKVESKENYNLPEEAYILGPGDKLHLKVFGLAKLEGEYPILPDGKVQLPIIGEVKVQYLSLQQATTLITNLYSKQLIRPELNLTLVKRRHVRVSLLGEVRRPGIYPLSREKDPTIIEAIQAAGGITEKANLKRVVLYRRLPGVEINHKETSLNILDLILDGHQSQNPFLFDGDIIRVEKAKEMPREIIELAANSLSPKNISVTVIGEVPRPGRFNVPTNTPLIQAILQAGGPIAWKANKGNVELVRINRNGSATRRKFKMDLNQGVSDERNPPLTNGDIVKVNQSALAKISGGLGAVTEPVSGLVTALSLFKLLN